MKRSYYKVNVRSRCNSRKRPYVPAGDSFSVKGVMFLFLFVFFEMQASNYIYRNKDLSYSFYKTVYVLIDFVNLTLCFKFIKQTLFYRPSGSLCFSTINIQFLLAYTKAMS